MKEINLSVSLNPGHHGLIPESGDLNPGCDNFNPGPDGCNSAPVVNEVTAELRVKTGRD
jgi:hypothetical protein